METQNTVDSQDLPKQLSDTAWNSILGFPQRLPKRLCWKTQQSAGTFSLLCFGSLKKARRGALYRKSMAIGMRSTVDSVDGAMRVFFRHCMNIFTRSPVKSLRSSLIRRWCVRIPAQAGAKKNGGQEARALGRSRGGFTTKTQSFSQRCLGPAALYFDGGTP